MRKPYIYTSLFFEPVNYCAYKHSCPAVIIHITNYYAPPLDLYKHNGCKVKGYLHLGFNNTNETEESFNEELANKTAEFVENAIIRNVKYIYIAYESDDKIQARSIGSALISFLFNKEYEKYDLKDDINQNVYDMLFTALKARNIFALPQERKKSQNAKTF